MRREVGSPRQGSREGLRSRDSERRVVRRRMGASGVCRFPAASRTAAVHRRRGRLDGGPPALRTLLGGLKPAAARCSWSSTSRRASPWMADWLNGSIGCVVSVAQDGERARGAGSTWRRTTGTCGCSGADPPAQRGPPCGACGPRRMCSSGRLRGPMGGMSSWFSRGWGMMARGGACYQGSGRPRACSERGESATIFGMPRAVIEAGLADGAGAR